MLSRGGLISTEEALEHHHSLLSLLYKNLCNDTDMTCCN